MMTSFIAKEESETVRRNRGNRHWKIDLCLKRCLKIYKKKTAKIPREIITVKLLNPSASW